MKRPPGFTTGGRLYAELQIRSHHRHVLVAGGQAVHVTDTHRVAAFDPVAVGVLGVNVLDLPDEFVEPRQVENGDVQMQPLLGPLQPRTADAVSAIFMALSGERVGIQAGLQVVACFVGDQDCRRHLVGAFVEVLRLCQPDVGRVTGDAVHVRVPARHFAAGRVDDFVECDVHHGDRCLSVFRKELVDERFGQQCNLRAVGRSFGVDEVSQGRPLIRCRDGGPKPEGQGQDHGKQGGKTFHGFSDLLFELCRGYPVRFLLKRTD